MSRTLFLLLPLLAACVIESPLVTTSADVAIGECEGNAKGRSSAPDADTADTGTAAEPGVEVEVVDGVLVLHYNDMPANCCPSPAASVAIMGSTLTVDLLDVTADEACNCECITDFDVTMPELTPGSWTVDALFNGTPVATLEVTI